jgi:hypothetical protein
MRIWLFGNVDMKPASLKILVTVTAHAAVSAHVFASVATQSSVSAKRLDCRVAALLAMTDQRRVGGLKHPVIASKAKQSRLLGKGLDCRVASLLAKTNGRDAA